jgi:hypothetical protein
MRGGIFCQDAIERSQMAGAQTQGEREMQRVTRAQA